MVKLLGVRSAATIAKFRNHIPSPIDIYYENHKGGSYQGSLEFGKEYSVNAYHGHVFYFTEKGNQSNEITRYTVKKEEVPNVAH